MDMKKFENLTAKLATLTGYDIDRAETEERAAGNVAPDVSFSKSYLSRLVAKAANVPLADVKSLPIDEYTRLTAQVSNFLFGSLAREITRTDSPILPSDSGNTEESNIG